MKLASPIAPDVMRLISVSLLPNISGNWEENLLNMGYVDSSVLSLNYAVVKLSIVPIMPILSILRSKFN
jgi:hypothetical protein